jgi:hypothetical protein
VLTCQHMTNATRGLSPVEKASVRWPVDHNVSPALYTICFVPDIDIHCYDKSKVCTAQLPVLFSIHTHTCAPLHQAVHREPLQGSLTDLASPYRSSSFTLSRYEKSSDRSFSFCSVVLASMSATLRSVYHTYIPARDWPVETSRLAHSFDIAVLRS